MDGLRKEIRLTLPTGRRRGEHIRALTAKQLEQFLSIAREQEQLGHATAALTTDLYGKWIPTEQPATDLATGIGQGAAS